MKKETQKSGFTLVEIMITTSIVGLLASLGIPNMLKAGENTRKARFARDIQTAGHAFVQYALENGDYPTDKWPGQMPNGMAGYLSNFTWSGDTGVGGQWDWDYEVFGIHAGVSVKSPTYGTDFMTKVDALIDDGNLGSGNFRTRPGGYIYILEE